MPLPKSAELWLPGYFKSRLGRLGKPPARRLWVALTDHFEPHGNASLEQAHQRMDRWQDCWPRIAADAPRDADGLPPCFTAFYPQEEYERSLLDRLAALRSEAPAESFDVEVHLHHFNDTAASFEAKLREFTTRLHNDHGLLHRHRGSLVFGFIHGNWALDNSHPTGFACGVTGELQILRDLGCYADFTMPSAPSPTQSRIVNQIYWTTGDPAKPRGFDRGIMAQPRHGRRGDLLMIEGPLGLRYRGRTMPRLETGELAHYDLPTPYRVQRWLDLAPRLGDDIFLKLYGHSAREDNAAAMLGDGGPQSAFAQMFQWIATAARQRNLELHWTSAFRMYSAIDAILQPESQSDSQPLPAPSQ